MDSIVFWDVDTQVDFIYPEGKLYVPGAETLVENLQTLTDFARQKKIQIMGSVDYHFPDDEEISDHPDFSSTYPPHCMANDEGSRKIAQTAPINPLWIDSRPIDPDILEEMVDEHEGEIYFRKQKFDVFSNPNVIPVLDIISPKKIFVYGVALDVCDAYAVEGFLSLNKYKIYVVTDAVRAINPEKGNRLLEKWKAQGVKLLTTAEVVLWEI